MQPRLILINGNPGMGKSTLAQLYADEHALTLNLDVDRMWHMMSNWEAHLPESNHLKRQHAYALADSHLRAGYDVIVPDVMETVDQLAKYERIAQQHGALFNEFVLLADESDTIERCKDRARRMGHAGGFRPGGVLDTHGREQMLTRMYKNVLATTAQRPKATIIRPEIGDIDGTYTQLVSALD